MRHFTAPLGCYEATITQDGKTVTVQHRCGSADCPDNN